MSHYLRYCTSNVTLLVILYKQRFTNASYVTLKYCTTSAAKKKNAKATWRDVGGLVKTGVMYVMLRHPKCDVTWHDMTWCDAWRKGLWLLWIFFEFLLFFLRRIFRGFRTYYHQQHRKKNMIPVNIHAGTYTESRGFDISAGESFQAGPNRNIKKYYSGAKL